MEVLIELVGGPDDGEVVHVLWEVTDNPDDWPACIHVSRAIPDAICTDSAVEGWPPERIASAFRTYKRTGRVNPLGQQIYEWKP